jgi:hypothetical protein
LFSKSVAGGSRLALFGAVLLLLVLASGCCGGGRNMKGTYQILRPGYTKPEIPGTYGSMIWELHKEEYDSYPELIGVTDVSRDARGALEHVMQRLNLENVTKCYLGEESVGGFVLRKAGGGAIDRINSEELRQLRNEGFRAGPVLRMSRKEALVFTNRISLAFKPSAGPDEIQQVFDYLHATDVRASRGMPNHYTLTLDPGIGEGINDLVERLLETDLMQYVYPDIWRPTEQEMEP